MNILLLGSKSFIGKHIYHQLKDKLNINSLDNYFEENDILRLDNTEFCEKYFSKLSFKIDIIINLVHIHKKSFKEELNINTKLVDKICYFVEQKKIRIIHISSVKKRKKLQEENIIKHVILKYVLNVIKIFLRPFSGMALRLLNCLRVLKA